MPAEWEPHAATWIAWPHNRSDWPGKFEPIPWIYAEIIRHLVARRTRQHPGERRGAEAKAREILVRCACAAAKAAAPGQAGGNIRFFRIPTNRVLDARLRTNLRSPRIAQGQDCRPSRPPRGASMPGPSTTTGSSTRRSRAELRERLRMPAWQPDREARRRAAAQWCWKAAASTSTAAAR